MTLDEENRRFLVEWYEDKDSISPTRDHAIEVGALLFMHNKSCRNGHHPVRISSSNRCAVCQRKGRKKYFMMNKESEYKRSVIRQKIRYREDPEFKAKSLLRECLKRTLKLSKKSKTEKTFNVLKYSVEDFMQSIESRFSEGMSWDNHGSDWQLDHVIPMGAFDLKNQEAFDYVNSVENLQPLWKNEHSIKTKVDLKMMDMLNTGVIPEDWIYFAHMLKTS